MPVIILHLQEQQMWCLTSPGTFLHVSYSLGLVFSPDAQGLARSKGALWESLLCIITSFSTRSSLDTPFPPSARQQMDFINRRLPIPKRPISPRIPGCLITNSENKTLLISHCYLTDVERSQAKAFGIHLLTHSSDACTGKVHLTPSHPVRWKHPNYETETNIPLPVQTNGLFRLPQQRAAYANKLGEHFGFNKRHNHPPGKRQPHLLEEITVILRNWK